MYMSCAETAKLVRKALKEAFPGQKFSVRSSTYSMGASIRVGWTDGPTAAEVSTITEVFCGASFDPMIDLKSHHRHTMNGQEISFGADYIFTERTISPEFTANLEKASARGLASITSLLAPQPSPTAKSVTFVR